MRCGARMRREEEEGEEVVLIRISGARSYCISQPSFV